MISQLSRKNECVEISNDLPMETKFERRLAAMMNHFYVFSIIAHAGPDGIRPGLFCKQKRTQKIRTCGQGDVGRRLKEQPRYLRTAGPSQWRLLALHPRAVRLLFPAVMGD